MTCGYVVNEAVDNPAYAWITTVILWIRKEIQLLPEEACAVRGRRMKYIHVGIGHLPKGNPGDAEGPGNRDRTR